MNNGESPYPTHIIDDEGEFHLVSMMDDLELVGMYLVSTMDDLVFVSMFLISTMDDLEIVYVSTKQIMTPV